MEKAETSARKPLRSPMNAPNRRMQLSGTSRLLQLMIAATRAAIFAKRGTSLNSTERNRHLAQALHRSTAPDKRWR